jgi:hypothetical protein
VAPAALEVSLAAAAQAVSERAMLDKLWRQRIERARYASDRARRQYQLAEPENRLVARQLETDWEAALAETGRLQADYQRFTEELPAALTAAGRTAIQALASDLPRVWDAPSTTQADRKELLRILIEKITVTVAGTSELVDITITWAGGHQTSGQAVRPVARLDQLSYYPALLARVTELAAAGRTHRQIAGVLNAGRLRPAKRTSRFTGGQVRTLISQRGIRGQRKGRPAVLTGLPPGQWSVPGLSAELGVPTASIYNWIYRGWIAARHAPQPGTGSSPSATSRCASYANAGHAHRATTREPAGRSLNNNPASHKEHNHEKAKQLDRYQQWPTSTFQRDPATFTSSANGTGLGAWAR